MIKNMKTPISKLLSKTLVTCMALGCSTLTGLALVDYETVTVGNVGNAPDPNTGSLYGSVNYEYQIGKYLVTNAQYAEFLNQKAKSDPYGLYNPEMGSSSHGGIIRSGTDGNYTYTVKAGWENKPVNFVGFGDAVRFANWLTNGQGDGSTEYGAYDLSIPLTEVTRSPAKGVTYYVTSEDEWYKAAYYDPTLNGGAGGYWSYATRSNLAPANGGPPGGSNSANYGSDPNVITDVGAYVNSVSYYGTYDQEGLLWERMDTIFGDTANRVRRSASYTNSTIGSSFRSNDAIDVEVRQGGFRLVVVVPEASTYGLILGGLMLGGVVLIRTRKS